MKVFVVLPDNNPQTPVAWFVNEEQATTFRDAHYGGAGVRTAEIEQYELVVELPD